VVEDVVAGEMIVPVGAPINHQTNNESTSLFEGTYPRYPLFELVYFRHVLLFFR